jgi:beta-lactamase regulating signal transducer with metallopeptidase domain
MNGLLNAVVSVTLVVTPLILLLLLVTPLMDKRYAAGGRYVLWMLVMAGLLMPFLPFGIRKPFTVNVPVPGVTATQSASNAAGVYSPIENAVDSSFVGMAQAAESIIEDNWYAEPSGPSMYMDEAPAQSGEAQPVEDVPVLSPGFAFRLPFFDSVSGIVMGIWLFGMLASLAFYLFNHFAFVFLAKRGAVPETDPGYLQVLNSERVRLEILQDIPLMRCKDISAPMLMGLFNPVILLPDIEFDSGDLPFIFRHELIHFKRHDLWYKLALTLVKCVHWFNPIVRLMAGQAEKDIETLCDAHTVNGMDTDLRRKYSEVILSMASGRNACRSRLTTCMNGGKHMLRQRFSNILGREKKNGALVFTLIGVLTFTDRKSVV